MDNGKMFLQTSGLHFKAVADAREIVVFTSGYGLKTNC